MERHVPIVDQVMRAAISYGLADDAAWPGEPLADEAFAALLGTAAEHRLVGTLAHAAFNGELQLTPAQRVRLADLHAGAQAHVLAVEGTLLRVAQVFGDEAIDFRVLKGIALAHRVYDDPSWRVASDVDVLVAAADFTSAAALIETALGGTSDLAELRPGFDSEFGKEVMVRVGNIEVDLHRTFVTGPFGLTINLDELFVAAPSITVADQDLPVLDAELQFLHACYNVAVGDHPVRLGSVRDLLLCLHVLRPNLLLVTERARSWRAEAVLQRAARFGLEYASAGVASELEKLSALHVPAKQRLLLRSYVTSARSYSRPLASLAVIPGVAPRVRYARAILAPSADYLRSRGWSRARHVRRAADRLLRRG